MHIVVSFSRLSIIVILTLTLTMIEYQSAAAAADANTLDSQSPNDKGGLSTINDFI
jgi:hypothetical protein